VTAIDINSGVSCVAMWDMRIDIGVFHNVYNLTSSGGIMNKSELIDAIAESAGLTKADAGRALDGFLGAVTGALSKGDSVALVGFGTYSVKERAERKGRNPQSGEEITIKAAKIPSFKAGKTLKDAVN
jgi:DNA-binding protein HU-beta